MSKSDKELTVGTILKVPRTGGHTSRGVVVEIKGNMAKVMFRLNGTYRGEIIDNNSMATKVVAITELLRCN